LRANTVLPAPIRVILGIELSNLSGKQNKT
jgi:hypothetical protein